MKEIPTFSQVIGNLWFGSYPDDARPFKYIFSLSGGSYFRTKSETLIFKSVFEDNKDGIPSSKFLHEVADLVISCIRKAPTLVHCMGGYNRSGLITALVLIKLGKTPEQAIAKLRDIRPEGLHYNKVLFNKKFEDWLLKQ